MTVTVVTIAKVRPRFQTQRLASDPHGMVNCSAYSLAMGIEFATAGNLTITGRQVRALSSEPSPDAGSPGLNIPQLVQVAAGLRCPIVNQTGKSFADLERFIDDGMGVLVQGLYSRLKPGDPFNGGHMILVTEQSPGNGAMLVWDPLEKAAKPYQTAIVRAYAQGLATNGGLRFATTRKPPYVGTVKET